MICSIINLCVLMAVENIQNCSSDIFFNYNRQRVSRLCKVQQRYRAVTAFNLIFYINLYIIWKVVHSRWISRFASQPTLTNKKQCQILCILRLSLFIWILFLYYWHGYCESCLSTTILAVFARTLSVHDSLQIKFAVLCMYELSSCIYLQEHQYFYKTMPGALKYYEVSESISSTHRCVI